MEVVATTLKFDSVASWRAIVTTGAGEPEQPHCMFALSPAVRFATLDGKFRLCVAAGVAA